jgi:DNA-binding transcriptional LysR family regulator
VQALVALDRMLGRFENYLGGRLFDRSAGGATLTEEGERSIAASRTDFAASRAA